MKKSLLQILVFLFACTVKGQHLLKIKIIESATQFPIENVVVENKSDHHFYVSDEYGNIVLSSLKKTVILTFKHLSYVEKKIELNTNSLSEFLVTLTEKNFRIDEIVLVGKNKKNSEIVLKEEAIQNVQAFTALEVLEQLPGQSVSEFSVNSFKNIVFRSADIIERNDTEESAGNKAFGTAIVVNDIPMSNNENMQSWVPNASGVFSQNFSQFGVSGDQTNTSYSNAGFGTDLRQISTENIEEIEVVQGIPSAQYGDLTSGLIKIKTKAGVTPLISSVSFRNGTTQVNTSKGFKITDKLGFVNIGLSYLNSKDDPKDVLNQFKRLNINTDWSFYRKKIKNTLSFNYSTSLDDGTQDPDDVTETFVKNENRSLGLSNRFNYNFEHQWVDDIAINLNFNYKSQYTLRETRVNLGGSVVPVGLTSGIFEGLYTPVSYLSTREIEGKPINAFADMQLRKKINTSKKWKHQFVAGATLRYSDNIGAGRIGNPETADNQFTLTSTSSGQTGFRPYSFLDHVRPEIQYAVYIQDDISKKWKDQRFNISTGLRWDLQNGYQVWSPRTNLSHKINKLKVRGGFGVASKAPSLNNTYTGKQYFDEIIGDFRTNTYNVAYVQTFVKEEQNQNLKPTISYNYEMGIDYDLNIVDVSITAYHKILENGLTSQRVFNNVEGEAYEIVNDGINEPTINITGTQNYIYEDLKIINGLTSKDYGVEFNIKIPKIEVLNLEIAFNGLYAKTINNDVSNIYTNSTIESENATIGVFNSSYTTINHLFRLGSVIKYHIPKVGLFLSFKTEHFLKNEFYYDDDFEQYPIAYLDQEYHYVNIPLEDRTNDQLYGHLFRPTITTISEANITHNVHMRISKDFLNGFRIDFYANNFLNFKPTYLNEKGDLQTRNITSLSFGMKLNYKF